MKRNFILIMLIVSIVLAVTSCAGSKGGYACPATRGMSGYK